MAKLWRKTNMKLGEAISSIKYGWKYPEMKTDIERLQKQKITHKEARTFFQSEQATPSRLFYRILYGSNWEQICLEMSEIQEKIKTASREEKKLLQEMYDAVPYSQA